MGVREDSEVDVIMLRGVTVNGQLRVEGRYGDVLLNAGGFDIFSSMHACVCALTHELAVVSLRRRVHVWYTLDWAQTGYGLIFKVLCMYLLLSSRKKGASTDLYMYIVCDIVG